MRDLFFSIRSNLSPVDSIKPKRGFPHPCLPLGFESVQSSLHPRPNQSPLHLPECRSHREEHSTHGT